MTEQAGTSGENQGAAGESTNQNAGTEQNSILDQSGNPIVDKGGSVLDTAGAEEKAAQEAETKRLMEADPATLSPEDVTKREALVKAKADADAEAARAEKVKGVPEKYELKAPDGAVWDEENQKAVVEGFKKALLNQEQAQAMVDLFVGQQKAAAEQSDANFKKFLADSSKETMDALGANAKTELSYVAKVKSLFSKETLDLLRDSGMGNMKPFIFDLAKVGRLFSEEKLVDGQGRGDGDVASKLYPGMNK